MMRTTASVAGRMPRLPALLPIKCTTVHIAWYSHNVSSTASSKTAPQGFGADHAPDGHSPLDNERAALRAISEVRSCRLDGLTLSAMVAALPHACGPEHYRAVSLPLCGYPCHGTEQACSACHAQHVTLLLRDS